MAAADNRNFDFFHFIYSELYAKIEARLKKFVLTASLVIGILLSAVYTVYSYIFTDRALLTIVGQTKPGLEIFVEELQKNTPLELVNQLGFSLLILLLLIAAYMVFSKKTVDKQTFWLALMIPFLLVFAYPTVSRDIFSYLYYTKMILVYHKNPYQVIPLANRAVDLWLGFVHNTDRTYAYGPISLLINLVPMAILGAEKLMVNLYFYKLTCLGFFLFGTWLLLQLTKNRNLVVALWILNPYILNELLINNHNDLMMIVFFWWAIYLWQNSKKLWSLLSYTMSIGTKYVTAPLLPLLFLSKKWQTILAIAVTILLPIILIYHGYLTWYFTWLYFCLPYLKLTKVQLVSWLLLQLSLTLGYAGFLETGMWGPPSSNALIYLMASSTKIFMGIFILTMVFSIKNPSQKSRGN